jgi:hypothetical protein
VDRPKNQWFYLLVMLRLAGTAHGTADSTATTSAQTDARLALCKCVIISQTSCYTYANTAHGMRGAECSGNLLGSNLRTVPMCLFTADACSHGHRVHKADSFYGGRQWKAELVTSFLGVCMLTRTYTPQLKATKYCSMRKKCAFIESHIAQYK